MTELRFDGKVVVVSCANSNLGQLVCGELLKKGAVVVAISPTPLDFVCKRVTSLEEFQVSIESFGQIDALISLNPASQSSSISMTSWEEINNSLFSIYCLLNPAWKAMKGQKFGKILSVSCLSSVFSDKHSAERSMAAYASLGLLSNLVREGAKCHVKVNSLLHAPFDENVFTQEKIIPVIMYLIHESCVENGSIIETSAGFVSKIRLQRGSGWLFTGKFQAEDIRAKFKEVNSFGKFSDHPEAYSESLLKVLYVNYVGKPKI